MKQLDESVLLQTQDEGPRPESPTEGCELPVVGRTTTANIATTVPRADSTITASTQEDNAPGLRWPAIGLQGALRVAPYSITQTNRITHFESNSPKRNKTRKDARHCKLAEEGFIPRTLTVKTKLSFTDRLKKGPETCKQLQD